MRILLKNAKLLINGKLIQANILIEGTTIKKISQKAETADKIIDLKNNIVLPGLIDAHVHLREPGLTYKEDFLTGSQSAAAGGVTTILDMPNTVPPTITSEALELKRSLARKSIVNYGFYFGAANENLPEILKAKNIAGIKIYMGSSTGNLLVKSQSTLENLFRKFRGTIAIHAEDEECLNQHKSSCPQKAEYHHKLRARECAIKAVKNALILAKKYKTNIHIAHITSKEETELISKAKKSGINVTCEVTPHHLFLSSEEAKKQLNFVKVNPPIREKSDRESLWKALLSGVIDIIATDHAPHTIEEKQLLYEKAPSGVPGLETMLPLLLDAFSKNKISLGQIQKLTSDNPAKIFKIRNKGKIKEGYDADLAVIDTKLIKKVSNNELFTKCRWSPFNGWKLKGWPIMTFVNGNLIYEHGTLNDTKAVEVNFNVR